MKRFLTTGLFVGMALICVRAYSQCQQQTCTDTGTCFKCSDVTTNVGCLVSSCNSCTTSRCSGGDGGGGGGGIGGTVCQKVPANISELKPAKLSDLSRANGETVFGIIGEPGAPAELTSFNISRDSVFRHGILLNTSKKEIAAYRLGWIFSSPRQGTSLELGPEIRFETAVPAGKTQELAEHPFPSWFFDKTGENRQIGFFIARIVFVDGTSWNADLDQVRNGKSPNSEGKEDKNGNKTHS